MMTPWVKSVLLPPMPFLAVAVVGLLLARRRWDIGWWLAAAALVALTLLATPLVAGTLLRSLENAQPLTAEQLRNAGAQAIVILSAEATIAPEYEGTSVGPLTLMRLRYGARVQVATGLPVLVSGGTLPTGSVPVAEAMRAILADEFHLPEVWAEDRSQDTWENARYSAEILGRQGVGRVLLVTHAWHMDRSRAAFERAGLEVVPAPTGFTERPGLEWGNMIPSAKALYGSHFALYEILGSLYYRFAKS
jgi:uncharacterized SAM-binding protein YcdF (DUF218 family)